MLRHINFNNGRVPAFIDRLLNYFQQSKPTGIFKDIDSECIINDTSKDYSTSGYLKFKLKAGLITVYGGAIYIDEDTEFKPYDITTSSELVGLPLTQTNTGSIGVRVDLSKPVGEQVRFYYKTTQSLVQQDLNELKTSGVYEFELYKYTSTGSSVTFTRADNLIKTNEDIINDIQSALKDATAQRIVYTAEAPTASPTDGTLIIYVGETLPATRYDGVLYFITK